MAEESAEGPERAGSANVMGSANVLVKLSEWSWVSQHPETANGFAFLLCIFRGEELILKRLFIFPNAAFYPMNSVHDECH